MALVGKKVQRQKDVVGTSWYIRRAMSTEPSLTVVATVIRRHLPSAAWRAVLFGSRARGEARPGSDWDIGLIGPGPLPVAVVQRIRADLEDLPTLHSFEVVDLAATPAGFREAALRGSVPLP